MSESAILSTSLIYLSIGKLQVVDDTLLKLENVYDGCRRCRDIHAKLINDREYFSSNLFTYHAELQACKPVNMPEGYLQIIVTQERAQDDKLIQQYRKGKVRQLARLHC